jgi:hypothetical protein
MADLILAAIDGALADHETSADAMRWSPDRVICDGGRPLMPAPPSALLGLGSMDPACLGAIFQPVSLSISADFSQFAAAMQRMAEAVVESLIPASKRATAFVSRLAHELDRRERPRWHLRNCRTCNPRGNPPPEAGRFKPGPKAARVQGRRRTCRG